MNTSNNIKKTITKKSTTKAQKIGRPINCFMAFRLEKHQEISSQSPGLNHRDISKIIAKWWKEASEAEKAPYRAIASKAKADHAKLYPDYKYQPVKKSERKVRPYHRREDAATRQRKSQAKEELLKQWMGEPASPTSSFCDSPSTPNDQMFTTPNSSIFTDACDDLSYSCSSPSTHDVQHPMTTDPSFFLDPRDDISSFCGSPSSQDDPRSMTTDLNYFFDMNDDDSSFCDSPLSQDEHMTPSFDESAEQYLCQPMHDLMSNELKSPPPPSLILSVYSTLDVYYTDSALPEYINPQMLSLYPGL